ncbi:MAG TPA: hypothetical protein VG755_24555 [Nannocystaceae bacterium]|nr:hypothetical protein [Nannocystaceae bacterium]
MACTQDPENDDAPADTSSGDEAPSDTSSAGESGSGDVTPEAIVGRTGCGEAPSEELAHSGSLMADEVWSADVVHHVTADFRVLANLTIDPCAIVAIDPGVHFDVGDTDIPGQLVARGEADDAGMRSIVFRAATDGSPWAELRVRPAGVAEIAIASISDAGANTGYGSALVVAGLAGGTNFAEPIASTSLDRVVIENAAGHGLELADWGALVDGSSDVWIRGSGSEAVRIEQGVAASLPNGLVLEDNMRDEILVASSKTFMRDDTFRDVGAPYRKRGDLRVAPYEDGDAVTLTIEPGVTIAFEDEAGSGIYVGSSDARQGVLIAEGTAESPITFTSAADAPVAGDWMGIVVAYVPISGTHLEHVVIEYAGGNSGHDSFGCGPKDNDAALIVYGQGVDDGPPDPVIESSSFDQIAGETVIVSGWVDDEGPNLADTNTFGDATPACRVSRPQRSGTGDVCDGGRDVCWG